MKMKQLKEQNVGQDERMEAKDEKAGVLTKMMGVIRGKFDSEPDGKSIEIYNFN